MFKNFYHTMSSCPPPGPSSSSASSFNSFPSATKRVKIPESGKPERKPRKNNSGDKPGPNPLISPTEKCKVCHEPAAKHIHYGAVTCFSCRAFFRRSIQNQTFDTYKCRKQGSCEITLKSRKSCQRCRFNKCLEVGMKSSWVLSEEERFRRFRKHREKVQQQQNSGNGSSPPNDGYYDERNSGDESYDDRMSNHYSPDREHERKYRYASGSPSYLTPPPLSPLSAHPEAQAVVAAAAAAQVSVFPGMDLNILRAAAAAQASRAPFVPPPHFMAMTSKDSALFGGLAMDAPMPGPSGRANNISTIGHDQYTIAQQHFRVKEEEAEDKSPQSSDEDEDNYNSEEDAAEEQQRGNFAHMPKPVTEITADELAQIKAIARIHDINYKSVNFGEELIKEMVMSSVFGVPLSVNATMTAYRLMIQRVTKVAQGFDAFIDLPHGAQSALLKNNADMIVSLRGAVFFEKRKGGLDQILITMGVDDLMAARTMVMAAMKTTELKRIDYQTFNSLQKVDNSDMENRYNTLLQRVGTTVSFDPDLVKMLTYVLLFSLDFTENDQIVRRSVEGTQDSMISMMRRYIFAQYAHPVAVKLFSGLLHCIADLQELTWIKKQRQLAAPASHIANDKIIQDQKPAPANTRQ